MVQLIPWVMVEQQAKIQFLGSVLGHHDSASRQHYTLLAIDRTEPKKKFRFAKQKIRFDFFGSTPTRPGRNLTRTFPKTEPKFGLQNLPISIFRFLLRFKNVHALLLSLVMMNRQTRSSWKHCQDLSLVTAPTTITSPAKSQVAFVAGKRGLIDHDDT